LIVHEFLTLEGFLKIRVGETYVLLPMPSVAISRVLISDKKNHRHHKCESDRDEITNNWQQVEGPKPESGNFTCKE